MSEYERDNRTVGELGIEARRIRGEIERINKRNGGAINVNGAEREERENLSEKALALDVRIAEGKQKHAALLRMASDTSRQVNPTDSFYYGQGQAQTDPPRAGEPIDLQRRMSTALQTVSRAHSVGELRDAAALRLDSLIRGDRSGIEAAYIAAVGSPEYRSAFRKLLCDPMSQHTLLEKERESLVLVHAALSERAALGVSTGSTGGFAVPLTLDPTIIATSDGVANPLRQIAKVALISTRDWAGVSSAGTTAHYRAEGTEVADDAPALVQPTCVPERVDSFIPFSVEVGMDWARIEQELVIALRDAKDAVESEKFINGLGHASNEPEGLVAGMGLASVIETASVGAFAIDDLYAVKQALGPRFRANGQWLMAGPILDATRRLVGAADPTEAPVFVDGDPPKVLGRPAWEQSSMDSSVAAGQEIAVFGDFRTGFAIVDRIGMIIEVVPHLFGTSHRPTGQRGLLAIWRNSSVILADEAFRLLKVKTTT